MTLKYIRDYYGVPAERGMRVVADGRRAEIRGAKDQYLLLRCEDDEKLSVWHPTWRMVYLR